MALTLREEKFCVEYFCSGNGTQSYRRAGWTNKDPSGEAARLLKKPDIQARIKALKEQWDKDQMQTRDFVLARLTAIADARIDEILDLEKPGCPLKPLDQIPSTALTAIQSIHVKLDGEKQEIRLCMASRLGALQALGSHAGLWDDLNQAIATLRKYGLELRQGDRGWEILDQNNP